MKKNGFTLVEVLAMLTVIGIIMVVSIPNISGMLRNQRLSYIKGDAISMIESAKIKVSKDEKLQKPRTGECVIFTLNYLDDDDDLVKGPNGGKYDQFDSVVVYTREDVGNKKKYKYYVRLVENCDDQRVGIHMADGDSLASIKTSDIEKIEDNTGLKQNTQLKCDNCDECPDTVQCLIKNFGSINSVCKVPEGADYDMVKAYYPGEEIDN